MKIISLPGNLEILPIINGYDLFRFLDSPPPEPTNTDTSGQIIVNSFYLPWHQQDQFLLAWIRLSLTETILAQVATNSTTRDLWRSLEDLFSSNSRTRLNELKRQIQTAKKGDSYCSAYLLQLRRIADELAFTGSPLSEDELVSATINGLGSEYNSIIAVVSTAQCNGPFSFSALRGLLLGHEALLQSQASTQSAAFHVGKGGGRYRTQQYPNQNHSDSNPPFTKTGLSQNISNSSTGLPSSDNMPICQICDRIGHKARLCYRRYDKDQAWKPQPKYKAYTTQTLPSNQDPTEWVIDSGANNHVTSDINNLSSFYVYQGPDKLQVGNDLELSISHIGSTSFQVSNSLIKLNNILHVPKFSTNLISLSKLLQDNPFLELKFCSSNCSIKDFHTKINLLQIYSHQGLYSLKLMSSSGIHNDSPPQAYIGTRTTTSI
jgi:gag-polypeptide of LTR copia-type